VDGESVINIGDIIISLVIRIWGLKQVLRIAFNNKLIDNHFFQKKLFRKKLDQKKSFLEKA